MKVSKEIAAWIRHAESLGWQVESTRQGHLRFKSPRGKIAHIPAKDGSHRSLANSKADLRRVGLTFPEDEYRKADLLRRGIGGLVDMTKEELTPAIVRSGAKIPRHIEDENIQGFIAANPQSLISLDDIVALADEFDESSGEEMEIEVEPARPEEEPLQPGNGTAPPRTASTAGAAPKNADRLMFIKFGRMCEQLNGLGEEHKKILVELLEQAALLELSAEEILEAIK